MTVSEANMARIWNKFTPLDKKLSSGTGKINPHTKDFGVGVNTPLKPKVFVGMSGGVDSSVSAALLKKAGYDVTGVFIKVWQPDWIECTWREDRLDAMRVCAKLGVPFITLDLEKEYKMEVVDYMIAEYRAGRTPNPDVMCNRYIKFGGFYDFAMENGADYIATGHYARVVKSLKLKVDGKNSKSKILQLTTYNLLVGSDQNKDQSYFLWTLRQEELSRVLFPVGHLEKPAVRALARKFGLPTADKKDSQGLCFIGKVDMKEFLAQTIKERPGKVLDESGAAIGTHPGSFFFTVGERHGFLITAKHPTDRPYYIVGKDTAKNTLTVSHKPPQGNFARAKKRVAIKDVNWISGEMPDPKRTYGVRVRYRQPLERARIAAGGKTAATVIFEEPQLAAPGQSLVLYDDETCLGGGIIK
jgi:tRNA-specific 2-thiouridylase